MQQQLIKHLLYTLAAYCHSTLYLNEKQIT